MDYLDECNEKMNKSLEALKESLGTLRAGRVSAGLLDKVTANVYGSVSPIKYSANVSVLSPTDLSVKPYDPGTIRDILAGINKADLGCTVTQNGNAIVLKFPAPSEDRRKDLEKQAKKYAEEAKVAVRNVRRDVNTKVKKDDALSEDMKKGYDADVQKATDKHIADIDKLLADKIKDIETI